MWKLIRRLTGNEAIERDAKAQMEVDRATADLVLYHFESCPFCRRVRRSIKRLNVKIALRDIQRHPEFRQELITGGGKKTVPCLRIGGGESSQWLYESSDIIQYLERRFAEGT